MLKYTVKRLLQSLVTIFLIATAVFLMMEDFKDVAYFEPFYLKEFVASQPKKLL